MSCSVIQEVRAQDTTFEFRQKQSNKCSGFQAEVTQAPYLRPIRKKCPRSKN